MSLENKAKSCPSQGFQGQNPGPAGPAGCTCQVPAPLRGWPVWWLFCNQSNYIETNARSLIHMLRSVEPRSFLIPNLNKPVVYDDVIPNTIPKSFGFLIPFQALEALIVFTPMLHSAPEKQLHQPGQTCNPIVYIYIHNIYVQP